MTTNNPISYFKPSNFKVQLKKELEILEIMATEINIPQVSLTDLQTTPHWTTDQKRPGDNLEYSNLTLKVIIDENLNSLLNLYDLMLSYKNPETGVISPPTYFTTSIFLTTNKNNNQVIIDFIYSWVKQIGNVQLQANTPSDEPITLDLDISYAYYTYSLLTPFNPTVPSTTV